MGESRDPEGQKAQASSRSLLLENQGHSERNKIEEKKNEEECSKEPHHLN